MKLIDALLSLLLAAVVLLHLVVAPYTKVEESFNLQAVHDLLVYGTPTGSGAGARLAARYDHFGFPGAVPRTFVGAVVLAGLSQPVVWLLDGPAAQFVVRGVLGLANAGALVTLARSLSATCGRSAGRWFLLLQLSQFHVMFYASRTLPNMFAFFLTTLAYAWLLPGGSSRGGRIRVALCLLVMAAAVFRAEVALLLAAVVLYLLLAVVSPPGSVSAVAAAAAVIVRTCAVAGIASLLASVPIDTYFWQPRVPAAVAARLASFPFPFPFPLPSVWPAWPELQGFLFNVWHGQASAWGVMPWHYYWTSALPRLLQFNVLIPLVLLPVAVTHPATRDTARLLVLPALLFVAVYSLQPHKEARFILYVVPPLTAAAALGADQLAKKSWGAGWAKRAADRQKGATKQEDKQKTGGRPDNDPFARNASTVLATTATAATAVAIVVALAASTAMLLLSALNYPGGEAMAALRQMVQAEAAAAAGAAAAHSGVTAHVDVLSCMTGVTLFGSALGPALPAHQAALDRRAATLSLGQRVGAVAANAGETAEKGTTISHQHSSLELLVDKTEDALLLRDPAFWRRFDYVLTEDPQTVVSSPDSSSSNNNNNNISSAQWETVAVIKGYAGIEVLRPGQGEEGEEDLTLSTTASPVLGHGATIDRLRRRVRRLTGGWWIGPRMTPQIYILKQQSSSGLPDSSSGITAR